MRHVAQQPAAVYVHVVWCMSPSLLTPLPFSLLNSTKLIPSGRAVYALAFGGGLLGPWLCVFR
jgi:hypothetical protein